MTVEPSTPTSMVHGVGIPIDPLTLRCLPRGKDCSVVSRRSVKNMASSPMEHGTSDLTFISAQWR